MTATTISFATIPLNSARPQKATKVTMTPSDLILKNASIADAVAIANVKSVGAPPPAWSGVFASYQQVQYQVVRWLRKPAQESTSDSLVVFHPVVAKSLTADAHNPKLREALFRVGSELILFLREKDSGLEAIDENYGAVRADPKTVEAVVHALDQRPRQPERAR